MGSTLKLPTDIGSAFDDWTESSRLAVEDGSVAVTNAIGDKVSLQGYGFILPQKARILGIKVRLKGAYALPGDVPV